MKRTKPTAISITDEEEEVSLCFSLGTGSSGDLSNLSGDNNRKNNNNDDEDSKLAFIPSNSMKPRLLPTEGSVYHKADLDEQQSDFLDSLQLLSISLTNEMELIQQYFPAVISSINHQEISLFEDEATTALHDAPTVIDFIVSTDDPLQIQSNPIHLSIKCGPNYPNEQHSCQCGTLSCPLISASECHVLKNKLNCIAQQLSKESHNCIIMMLIELEKRLSILNTKGMSVQNSADLDMKRTPKGSANSISGLGSMSLLNDSGFFDSLNSLHDVTKPQPQPHEQQQKQEQILPSSFTALQDIQTTKTWDEKKAEDEYAEADRHQLCPKMCGAVWGANGELIFFNNILMKRPRHRYRNGGRKLSLQQERDSMVSLQDYNRYLEKCGADGIHSDELHSIRKRVFANHFDEDEDRFADEFVVGFSLYHQQSQTLLPNGNKSKYYPYRNAYLHRSLSFLHHQHHHAMRYRYPQTQLPHDTHYAHPHHVHIPRLVLPSALHHHQNRNMNDNIPTHKRRKKRYRHRHHEARAIAMRHKSKRNHNNNIKSKEGNARIFCPGVIRFMVQFPFSQQLVSRHKLRADEEYSVASLCIYNAAQCKCLRLNRLSKVLTIFSTFLETANCSNTLVASPYRHHNYMAKFVQKAMDELYFNNELQGIAIVACLLRQSQFFVLLFDDSDNNYCGYLLQACVAQYLAIIQDRMNMNDDQINDVYQLQHFAHLLKKQKQKVMRPINGA